MIWPQNQGKSHAHYKKTNHMSKIFKHITCQKFHIENNSNDPSLSPSPRTHYKIIYDENNVHGICKNKESQHNQKSQYKYHKNDPYHEQSLKTEINKRLKQMFLMKDPHHFLDFESDHR